MNKESEILSVNEERPLHFILLLQNQVKLKNSVDFGTEREDMVQRKKTQERGAYVKCHLTNELDIQLQTVDAKEDMYYNFKIGANGETTAKSRLPTRTIHSN